MIKVKYVNGHIDTYANWKLYNLASIPWPKVKMVWHVDMGLIWPSDPDCVSPPRM